MLYLSVSCSKRSSYCVNLFEIKKVTKFITIIHQTPFLSGIRGLGSAACNICAVASGQTDAYFETGMHIWDICASGLILQEAKGVITDTDGMLSFFAFCTRVEHFAIFEKTRFCNNF